MTAPKHRSRGRLLTPEEAAHYAVLRKQINEEKPEILARSQRRLIEVQDIGRRFREAREEAGMSLGDLSTKTGIDSATLSKFENGVRSNPTLNTLVRLADALDLRMEVQLSPKHAASSH